MIRPSMQFYPRDWLAHPGLRMCSLAARGLWMDMMSLMHSGEPYGYLNHKGKDILPPVLARIVGESLDTVNACLAELLEHGVVSQSESGAMYSGRMVKDEHTRQVRAAGGVKSLDNPNVPRPQKDGAKDRRKVSLRVSPASASASANNNPLPPAGDVDAVLEHYQKLHPKRKIVGKKLRSVVIRALADFSVAELVEALNGNAADTWHKDKGKHELSYVLRDTDMINGFRDRANRPPTPPSTETVISIPTRRRAERLYAELPRHGFTQNLPFDQHYARAEELSMAGTITDLAQFRRELDALLPLTWLRDAREFDREKSIARIAAAIAPIQERAA